MEYQALVQSLGVAAAAVAEAAAVVAATAAVGAVAAAAGAAGAAVAVTEPHLAARSPGVFRHLSPWAL